MTAPAPAPAPAPATVIPLLKPGREVSVDGASVLIRRFIQQGGTSEIYEASCGLEKYALKVYFPSPSLIQETSQFTQGAYVKMNEFLKMQAAEFGALSDINHPNIVRVLGASEVEPTSNEASRMFDDGPLPVLLMELVDGLPLTDAITEFSLTGADVLKIFIQLGSALDYIHALPPQGLLHFDIHASNVLVERQTKRAVLIDFGSVKNMDLTGDTPNTKTRIHYDPGRVPDNPITREVLRRGSTEGITRTELRRMCFPRLDIYNFGQLMREVLGHVSLADEIRGYLELVIQEFTSWDSCGNYLSRLETVLSKSDPQAIDYFSPLPSEPVLPIKRIPLPNDEYVVLDGALAAILKNRSFRRLFFIRQLSLIAEIYPGAGYSRGMHALVTLMIARRLAGSLVRVPRFRLLMEPEHIRQLFVIALMHDINHFPFLHVLQEANPPGLDNAQLLDLFMGGEMTGELREGAPSLDELISTVRLSRDDFYRLAYRRHEAQTTPQAQILNSIISSGADIDKISYLTQDAFFTGTSFGKGIPIGVLTASGTVARVPGNDRWHLAYEDRAREAVEAIFMARYWSFRQVYWHHTNRALMAMILHVVRRLSHEAPEVIRDYASETLWMSDVEAMLWLDEKYSETFQTQSPLRGLRENREVIFRRLYTAKPRPNQEDWDSELSRKLSSVFTASFEEEALVRRRISQAVSTHYHVDADETDVLIDVPSRVGMNKPGVAYLDLDGEALSLASQSEPIARLSTNYDIMTQRVRVFISPKVAQVITPTVRKRDRQLIQQLLIQVLADRPMEPKGVS